MASRTWKVVDVREFAVGGELETKLNELQVAGFTIFTVITMKEFVVKIIAFTPGP